MGEVEGLPVLDGFWVDFAGDFVPGLEMCGLVCVVVSGRIWWTCCPTSRG